MKRSAATRHLSGRVNGFVFLALLLAVTGGALALSVTYSSSSYSGFSPAGSSGPEASRALVTASIDESAVVTLRGNTRPEANAANDRGPVADDFPMTHLMLQLR